MRTSSTGAPASTLSGGNQQKVVLARELSRPLRLLIVAQPTRGLDVGSMEFVHRRIVAERDRGAAVVLISTELDEVLGLADRIGVMYRGKIVGEVPPTATAGGDRPADGGLRPSEVSSVTEPIADGDPRRPARWSQDGAPTEDATSVAERGSGTPTSTAARR